MGRKRAREATMKLLYQMEMNSDYSDRIKELFFENNSFSQSEKEYIEDAINTIVDKLHELDKNIKEHTEKWNIHRLAKVDLCTLRIAIYEILYRDDIPLEVSINEAIEIAKKYSTEESSRFINGVLGGFIRSIHENEQ
ncbi:MAG TPA: transcription antitermination factor NusB [Tissierellia bacterium]|nr:transcription antitermination factor NusB [Tissierellia bacterium]